MIDSYSFLSIPFDFQNICKIYPPKIKEILSESNYPVYKKLFFSSQEDIEDEFTEQKLPMDSVPTPLEYLFELAKDSRIKKIILEGIEFFIKEPVVLLLDQQIIIIGDLKETLPKAKSVEDLRIIDKNNYFEFQNALRRAIGEKEVEPYNPNENPRVKYFKAKARLRDRVKAKSKNTLTLGATLASICCMGIGLNPLNIGEMSYACVQWLIGMEQQKEEYDVDIRALLAGADSKKVKPKYWIKNID